MKIKINTKENMISYYFDLLTYTKAPKHRKYIVSMLGYICGELPNPEKKPGYPRIKKKNKEKTVNHG